MDAKTAEALLVDINNSKEAEEFSGLASWLPDMSAPSPVGTQLVGDIGQQAHNNAVATTIKLLLSGAGAGAAMRGFSGLRRLMSPTVQNTAPTQTVEMPVTYPRSPKSPKTTEKKADPTAARGIPWFLPATTLGMVAATYGGWKGVDAILDKQRRAKTDAELEDAKLEYEQSLLNSYGKRAEDADLDTALDAIFSKFGEDPETDWWSAINSGASSLGVPNLPGMSAGALATLGIGSAGLGFHFMNDRMKKNSRRALLEKAIKERAHQRAVQQPAELYARPIPMDEE